jgi:ABC-type nickel/cobalt efflux system permease component RcnA
MAMNSPLLVMLLVAFVLGLKHSTEADHIAAVSTLVTDTRGAHRGALVGAFWGLGHLVTLFLAGATLILLHIRMSPRLEWSLEFLVALVLIGLGIRTLRRAFRGRYHFHEHQHGGRVHAHIHFHAPEKAPAEHGEHAPVSEHHGVPKPGTRAQGHGLGPMFVGMAHGLAGTAGLMLLILATIPSRLFGVVYLLVFGSGALVGMAGFGALLGAPLGRVAERLGWLRAARFAAGAASCGLGCFLAYRALLPGAFPF